TEWKLECPDPSTEAFIFASQSGGFLDASNFRHRVLGKLERELGLPKLTFQVIRRTTATLAQKMGTVKDVQGLLRHSRTATTTDVYMQEIPEGVRATVDSFHRELKADSAKQRISRGRFSRFATKCYQPAGMQIRKLLILWWTWSGSNRRPLPCHGSALPAAPQAHFGGRCNSPIFSAGEGFVNLPRLSPAETFPFLLGNALHSSSALRVRLIECQMLECWAYRAGST